MGDDGRDGRRRPASGRTPRVRHRRQRPARHHLRRLRPVQADRRLSLVLVGRRPGRPPRRRVPAARAAQPGHAGGEVPRVLHQRREPGDRHVGARVLRTGQGARLPRRPQRRVLRQDLRDDAAAQGQLPVAGRLGPRVRRGRPAEPRDRDVLRRGHGYLARGADDARHRGVEPARGQRHRPVRRRRRVELPPQRRRAQGVLAGRHRADEGPEHRGRGDPRHARQRRRQPARRRRHRPDELDHRQPAADPGRRGHARRYPRCRPSTRRSSGTGTRATGRRTT